MDKSPEAFRTISEVADALETPAHVLRFWESRFPQIKPVKRAGGRRYYRPSDVALLTGIKRLLHDEGMTIRGVQKILREQGIRHVSGLSDDISPEEEALEAAMAGRLDQEAALPPGAAEDETAAALAAALAEERGVVLPFPAPEDETAKAAEPDAAIETPAEPEAEPAPFVEAAPDPQPDLFTAPPAPRPVESPPPVPAPAAKEAETATLAARLRALPCGSLAGQAEPLAGLAARIAALRDRMGGLPPRA